jgi:hypothetical protein
MLDQVSLELAMQAVTDRYKGARFNLDALVSLTLEKLGHDSMQVSSDLRKQVEKYVRANVGEQDSGSKLGYYECGSYHSYWVWKDVP